MPQIQAPREEQCMEFDGFQLNYIWTWHKLQFTLAVGAIMPWILVLKKEPSPFESSLPISASVMNLIPKQWTLQKIILKLIQIHYR
jgi:hypothetical protein